MYDKPAARSVVAELGTFVHKGRTTAEDHAVVSVRFEGDRLGLVEVSWAKPGGMDDRAEIVGSQGLIYADLLRGSSLTTFSEVGYGYAVEKSPDTRGWSFTMFEELWNYGFPQEMDYFARCVAEDLQSFETGEDGRAVLEIIYGAYRAARVGRVELPLEITAEEAARPPIDQMRAPTNGEVQ
jgi:predicted dehydrogenase